MSKLPIISGQKAIKSFEGMGFKIARQKSIKNDKKLNKI